MVKYTWNPNNYRKENKHKGYINNEYYDDIFDFFWKIANKMSLIFFARWIFENVVLELSYKPLYMWRNPTHKQQYIHVVHKMKILSFLNDF